MNVETSGPGSLFRTNKTLRVCVLLALLVLGVFAPSLQNGFVNYDDPVYVTENPYVQKGLNWEGVCWAFSNLRAGFWHPLTWLSHMLDCQLFGLHAWGHHLTALMLHLGSTVLLFLLLSRLTGTIWRSAFVAALFGLHPLHVESVVWVAERKDVLSTFFGFLSLLFYARYVESKNRQSPFATREYLLALSFFACGLMSKSMLVTLPIIMLALDYWPLNRFAPGSPRTVVRLILEKLPFFALAFAAGLLTLYAESAMGAVSLHTQRSVKIVTANAILSCWQYLWQMIRPVDMAACYPYPDSFSAVRVIGAGGILLGISVVAVWLSRRHPYVAVGWFWYLVTLLPVSGLVQVGSHSRADRYTYVPLIGVFIMLTWGVFELTRRWRNQAVILTAVASVTIVLCAAVTRQQTGFWRNSETLFRHVIEVTDNNPVAHLNLGAELREQGRLDDAIGEYQKTLSLRPNDPLAHCGLGIALDKKGLVDEAIVHYLISLRSKPDHAELQNSLGVALRKKGLFDEATVCFEKALKLKPELADAHHNLGFMLERKGRLDEAILQYRQALELKPNAQIENDLGVALGRKGQSDEAIVHLLEAMKLDPNSADVRYNLGNALARKGRLDEAAAQLQESLRLDATSADVHNNLGVVLSGRGRLDEAIMHFQEAVRLNPAYAEAHTNLAAALRMKEASALRSMRTNGP